MKLPSTIFGLLVLATLARAQDSVTTLAGQPQLYGTTNGIGTNAMFFDPAGMAVDTKGNIYVADSGNDAIRIVATNGLVGTFAGKLGIVGTADGVGTNAQFNAPCGLTFDRSGTNLLVSDTGNGTIRKITPNGSVTTIAGVAGQNGFADGAAGTAQFGAPLGIAVAASSSIFIADGANHVIRQLASGIVSTLAGNPGVWGTADGQGTNAQFNAPCGVALDGIGNLFVSDSNNHTIRKISPTGMVTTYAGAAGVDGSADGPRATARFCRPAEMAFDHQGNLLVADSFNHTIRKISTNGIVSTVSGVPGNYSSADGVNGQGRFFNPYGLAFDPNGALLVADTYNELIRQVLIPFQLSVQSTQLPPTFTLTWDAVVGRKYQVQFKDNLLAGWTNLGALVTATGTSVTQTNSLNRSQSQRHYRVLLWP